MPSHGWWLTEGASSEVTFLWISHHRYPVTLLQRPVCPESDFHLLILHILSPDSAMWYRIQLPTVPVSPCMQLGLLTAWMNVHYFCNKTDLERTSLRVTFSQSTVPHPPSLNQPDGDTPLCAQNTAPYFPVTQILLTPFPLCSTRLSSWKASPQTHTSWRYSNTQKSEGSSVINAIYIACHSGVPSVSILTCLLQIRIFVVVVDIFEVNYKYHTATLNIFVSIFKQ